MQYIELFPLQRILQYICKFKLIAFLGNYSMYCIRLDPLRTSKRVWLRETKLYHVCIIVIHICTYVQLALFGH